MYDLSYYITTCRKNQVKNDWWGHLGSNQGPIGYEPTALTTELCPQKSRLILARNVIIKKHKWKE